MIRNWSGLDGTFKINCTVDQEHVNLCQSSSQGSQGHLPSLQWGRLGALFIDYSSLALFSHLFSLFFLSCCFIIHLYVSVNTPARHSTFSSSTLPLHQKTISPLLRAASSWSTPTPSIATIHLHFVSFIHSHIPLPYPSTTETVDDFCFPLSYSIAVFHHHIFSILDRILAFSL